jgi:hypothetical protein
MIGYRGFNIQSKINFGYKYKGLPGFKHVKGKGKTLL